MMLLFPRQSADFQAGLATLGFGCGWLILIVAFMLCRDTFYIEGVARLVPWIPIFYHNPSDGCLGHGDRHIRWSLGGNSLLLLRGLVLDPHPNFLIGRWCP